jgi:hypothetical protein
MSREDYTHRMVNGKKVPLTEAEKDECFAREEEYNAEMPNRALKEIRAERDKRLSESDVILIEDHPENINKASWIAYRQALRDLPANIVDPVAFVVAWNADETRQAGWPTPPST